MYTTSQEFGRTLFNDSFLLSGLFALPILTEGIKAMNELWIMNGIM